MGWSGAAESRITMWLFQTDDQCAQLSLEYFFLLLFVNNSLKTNKFQFLLTVSKFQKIQ